MKTELIKFMRFYDAFYKKKRTDFHRERDADNYLKSIQPSATAEEEKEFIGCTCKDEDKHGWTIIKCCNECGKPIEPFWVDQ